MRADESYVVQARETINEVGLRGVRTKSNFSSSPFPPQYQKNSDIGDHMLKKTSPAASLSASHFFSVD
jgi:hypothetical protein